MTFLFPESMILLLGRKMEDGLPQRKNKNKSKTKKNETMILSSNVLKRWSFQKIAQEYDFSCIIWKDGIFSER